MNTLDVNFTFLVSLERQICLVLCVFCPGQWHNVNLMIYCTVEVHCEGLCRLLWWWLVTQRRDVLHLTKHPQRPSDRTTVIVLNVFNSGHLGQLANWWGQRLVWASLNQSIRSRKGLNCPSQHQPSHNTEKPLIFLLIIPSCLLLLYNWSVGLQEGCSHPLKVKWFAYSSPPLHTQECQLTSSRKELASLLAQKVKYLSSK